MEKNTRRDFLKRTAVAGAGAAIGAVGLCGCCEKEQSRLKSAAQGDPDFSRIAYCGIYCDTCPLYKATIDNDDEAKMALAKEWKFSDKPDFNFAEFYCHGCKDRRSCGVVGEHCTVRPCALKRGLAVCSQCSDLETCDDKLWKGFPWIHDKAMQLRSEPGIL